MKRFVYPFSCEVSFLKKKIKDFVDVSFSGMFSKLLKTADKFFEKFNIRRLKLGTMMAFLERLDMTESKTALARVLRNIKV